MIVEGGGGVTGLVTLRKTRRGRNLRDMAGSVSGTLKRGMKGRRRGEVVWVGFFSNPPHWSTDSLDVIPVQYVKCVTLSFHLSLLYLPEQLSNTQDLLTASRHANANLTENTNFPRTALHRSPPVFPSQGLQSSAPWPPGNGHDVN